MCWVKPLLVAFPTAFLYRRPMTAFTEARTHLHSSLRGIDFYEVHLITPYGTGRCTYFPIMHPSCIDVKSGTDLTSLWSMQKVRIFQENARSFHYFLAFKIHKHRIRLSVNFFSGNFSLTQILSYFFSDLYNSHFLLPPFLISSQMF